jgi:hypothetical protein
MALSEALPAPWRVRRREVWERARNHPAAPLVLFALASRALLVLVAVVAGSSFPQHIAEPEGWNAGFSFTHWFARWDSGHYTSIAQNGYDGESDISWAFDPGYPLTIAAFRLLFPFVGAIGPGFLISNACLLVSVVLLFELTRRLFDERTARQAAILLAVAPGTVYLSAVYADALFLALVLGFFLALNGERWALASALGGLAAITRPPGLVLLLALIVGITVAWHRSGQLPRRAIAWAPLSLVPQGLLMAYSQWRTGDALVSFHNRELYWSNVEWHSPLPIVAAPDTDWWIEAMIHLGFATLVAACAFVVWDLLARRRLDALPVYAFSLALAVIYLTYSDAVPILRYLLAFLPLYWAAARIATSRCAFAVVVCGSATIAAAVTGVFATWGPLY